VKGIGWIILIAGIGVTWGQSPSAAALEQLRSEAGRHGLEEADLLDVALVDESQDSGSGLTHLYFRQRHQGIEIHNTVLGIHLNQAFERFHLTHNFVRSLGSRSYQTEPALSPQAALQSAAAILQRPFSSPMVEEAETGISRRASWRVESLSRKPIALDLVYFAHPRSSLVLAWRVIVEPVDSADHWEMLLDAADGTLLERFNWTVHCQFDAPQRVFPQGHEPAASPAGKASPGANPKGGASSQYRALPLTIESPNHGSLQLLDDPFEPTASPYGWHDTNGAAGAEYQITRGNNVHAFQDRDGNDSPAGDEPNGGPSLVFNLTPDFNLTPSSYTDAATINLFVWNNFVHDLTYFYGFDEAAGNFQQNNYGNGGLGSDYVRAEAQAGADAIPPTLNNANFSTPPDGSLPRMRMYEWTDPLGIRVDITAPVSMVATYPGSPASFGPALPDFPTVQSGTLQLVTDGAAPVNDGCTSLVGFVAGRIAVIDRGGCEFGLKVLNAQNAGAVAAIIVNNVPGDPITMGPGASGGSVTIPSTMLSQTDGTVVKNGLIGGETITVDLSKQARVNRDSDYDSGIIAHEYGHGVSNRLTGGPGTTSCLGNQEQMGEGWSDFLGLCMTTTSADNATEVRGIGTYPSFQATNGPGIRPYPYTTDLNVNPMTYATISAAGISVPHGVGSVWCTVLWDMYWALVDRYGFDDDLYHGTGGNNLALRLVQEGMKLQPCSPGFVTGRDGILAADQALTGGANTCLLWEVFARRGLGINASQGSSNTIGDEVEDFTEPSNCCEGVNILLQPQSASACEGEQVILSVSATGTSLEYQWQRNGVDIVGAEDPTYAIASLSNANAGNYTCVLTTPCDSETTTTAVVSLLSLPAYSTTLLPGWNGLAPVGVCLDVNGNGVVDVIDLSNLVP
jgi:hypothetical protein